MQYLNPYLFLKDAEGTLKGSILLDWDNGTKSSSWKSEIDLFISKNKNDSINV